HLGNAACAIGHRGDGLSATDLEDLVDAAGARHYQYCRIRSAVLSWWCADDLGGAAGNVGRYAKHDGSGGQRRHSSGYIQPYSVDGTKMPFAHRTRESLYPQRVADLCSMEAMHIVDGLFQRRMLFGSQRGLHCFELFRAH